MPSAFFQRYSTAILLFWAVFAHGSENTESEAAWTRLKEGTAVAIMRHALAPGTGDPADFVLGNCSTQRNLSAQGRSQARKIGDLFRDKGITETQVFTSEWCRCQETAQMLDMGEPTIFSPLNSFFQNRSLAGKQTTLVRKALPNWLQEGSTPTLLVTHQVNIRALTGEFTNSGEILIISLEGDNVVVLASGIELNQEFRR